MEVVLVMFKSDGTRRDFPIRKSRVVAGRTNTCDLRIPLSSVSRQHCELTVNGDRIHLRDLGSSNGTFHNGIRIQEATLEAGDEIGLGPIIFTLVVDGQPANIKPVRSIIDSSESQAGEEFAGSPRQLASSDGNMPEDLGAESHTPTVELDEEDPISALEAMANAEDDLPTLDDDEEDERR